MLNIAEIRTNGTDPGVKHSTTVVLTENLNVNNWGNKKIKGELREAGPTLQEQRVRLGL